MMSKNRCEWAGRDGLMRSYHDKEWGVPLKNDQKLFEFLILEGAQAGLSWSTILKKREAYRKAYDGFDPLKVSKYSEAKKAKLLKNPGIVRNRLKIKASIQNANAFLTIQKEFGSFSKYLWGFVQNSQVQNRWKKLKNLPAATPVSDKLSRDLKLRGFSFVGSTICYAFMQAVGLVNDHTMDCYRFRELKGTRK